jgi:hypothetical protein
VVSMCFASRSDRLFCLWERLGVVTSTTRFLFELPASGLASASAFGALATRKTAFMIVGALLRLGLLAHRLTQLPT